MNFSSRIHKYTLALIITVVAFTTKAEAQYPKKSESIDIDAIHFEGGGGFGDLINKDYQSSLASSSIFLSLYLRKKFHTFSFKYRNTFDYYQSLSFTPRSKPDQLSEFNFQYGLSYPALENRITFSLLTGIGLGTGNRRAYYGEEISYNYSPPQMFSIYKNKTILVPNIPLEAKFIWAFSKFFGITVNAYTSLNTELVVYGCNFGICFGDLRP